MLPNPLNQVTGYPNVQRTVVSTRQNINRRLFFHDATPIKRSHPNHLSHYSHTPADTTLSIMNHFSLHLPLIVISGNLRHIRYSSSRPPPFIISVTPHHIRHSRESGNPHYPENLDSAPRLRGGWHFAGMT